MNSSVKSLIGVAVSIVILVIAYRVFSGAEGKAKLGNIEVSVSSNNLYSPPIENEFNMVKGVTIKISYNIDSINEGRVKELTDFLKSLGANVIIEVKGDGKGDFFIDRINERSVLYCRSGSLRDQLLRALGKYDIYMSGTEDYEKNSTFDAVIYIADS